MLIDDKTPTTYIGALMAKRDDTEALSSVELAQRQGINQRKRQWYEESTLFFGRICLKLGLTPNLLTGISLVCALISGICFWRDQMIWGVFWILMTGFTDMLDGSTARAAGTGTTFGGILDHVSDRFGEFFVIGGITLSGATSPALGLYALFGMLIASYVRAVAESIGKLENCAVGIMGRTEKVMVIIVGAIIEHFAPVGTFPKGGWLELALIIVGTASIITAIQRMVFAKRALDQRERR
jgi:phosphatidylglycerophosphate synthase